MSKWRFRFYAGCFLFGSFADYYVRFWEGCYERPITNITLTSWLLAIVQAIDWLQYPISIARKEMVVWLYMLPDRLHYLPPYGVIPILILMLVAEFTVLTVFPLLAALIYTFVIGSIERGIDSYRPRS